MKRHINFEIWYSFKKDYLVYELQSREEDNKMMCSKSYEKKNEKFEIGNQNRIHRKKEI